MDKKEFTASNFIPKDLLEIICILERGKKHHSYKGNFKKNEDFSVIKFFCQFKRRYSHTFYLIMCKMWFSKIMPSFMPLR